MTSSCPGMGQQQQPPHAPVTEGEDALWHPSLVGDTVLMPCAFEEESCHVKGCSGSLLLPPASIPASKSHLSQPVWPQEVGSGTGDHPVSTSFVTEVV